MTGLPQGTYSQPSSAMTMQSFESPNSAALGSGNLVWDSDTAVWGGLGQDVMATDATFNIAAADINTNTIAFEGDSLTFGDSDGNTIMEMSNGTVKIFGDLIIEKNGKVQFNDIVERSIDETINELKNIIGGGE